MTLPNMDEKLIWFKLATKLADIGIPPWMLSVKTSQDEHTIAVTYGGYYIKYYLEPESVSDSWVDLAIDRAFFYIKDKVYPDIINYRLYIEEYMDQ
jgi:hypothetical protein